MAAQPQSVKEGLAGQLPTQLGEAAPEGSARHALEVEWRIEQPDDLGLKSPERVSVPVRDGEHAQMCFHPFSECLLVDGGAGAALCVDGAQGASESGELVPLAQVHACDARPQRVRGALAARPPGGACETGVDQARLDLMANPFREVGRRPLVGPPAVEARQPETGGAVLEEGRRRDGLLLVEEEFGKGGRVIIGRRRSGPARYQDAVGPRRARARPGTSAAALRRRAQRAVS